MGIGFALLISAGLVAWILRDLENPEQIWQHIGSARFSILLLVLPINILGHLVRASRWRRLISSPVSLFYSFSSVMIGYAVNGVVPRGGELARLVNMNRMTGVPFVKLLASLLAERVLDLVTLLGLIGLSFAVHGDTIAKHFPSLAGGVPMVMVMTIVLFGGILVLGIFPHHLIPWARALVARFHEGVAGGMEKLMIQGAEGLRFLKSGKSLALVFAESVLVWLALFSTYAVAAGAFGLFDELGLLGSAVGFSITNASVLVPSAGAIGAFHKFGQDALVFFYDVDATRALAFVTVLHLIAYYVVPIGCAIVCWPLQLLLGKR